MIVKEMIELFQRNPHGWCRRGCNIAISKLRDFPDNAPIRMIALTGYIITPEWAYHWAKDVGYVRLMTQAMDKWFVMHPNTYKSASDVAWWNLFVRDFPRLSRQQFLRYHLSKAIHIHHNTFRTIYSLIQATRHETRSRACYIPLV